MPTEAIAYLVRIHANSNTIAMRKKRALAFANGGEFVAPTDAVIGAEVAAQLGYVVGDQIVVSHGIGATSFVTHDRNPFFGNRDSRADRNACR